VIRAVVPHASEDLVAFGEGGRRTAADLLGDAAQVASALRAFPPGDVALAAADRYLFAVALLGAWSGGRGVDLPPNGQEEAVRAVARACASGVLLHDRAGAGDGVDVRALLEGRAAPARLPDVPPGQHLVTLWTSGSAGPPRPIGKTAAQILGEARTVASVFGLGRDTRIVSTAPAHHIYGLLFGVLAPLSGGGAFGRETPLLAEAVAASLARSRATHLASTPAHLGALVGLDGLERLRCGFSSGAALPAATSEQLRHRFGLVVHEIYGSTETGGVAHRDRPGAPWRPFPDVTVSVSAEGLLGVDSPLLPPGAPRPFATGDRARLRDDGGFELLGRADDVVKVAGKRVALSEVEARLRAVPGVRDAAVVALPASGIRELELRAAVIAPGLDERVIRGALLDWLDPVTVPRRILLVETLPRDATGKLPRERLSALWEGDVLEMERIAEEGSGWFEGHFDGFPVLPGIVQILEFVLRPARERWPGLGAPVRLRRLKFKRLIRPGDVLTVRIARKGGGAILDFEIRCGAEPCATGLVDLA